MTTWTIQEVARRTGLTSRTLRHYDDIGLLPASEIGHGGIRHYDDHALVRLQRILLLKDLGLGLSAIAEVVDSPTGDEISHLRRHLELLELERQTLDRRITAVRTTITAREGVRPMTADMFDGFDHTQYQQEVEQRWGKDTHATSDAWWRSKSAGEKKAFQQEVAALSADWVAAARDGESPTGERARALAARHIAWLTGVPGTPGPQDAYVRGLAEMYVADDRFRANYTGSSLDDVPHGPEFVRDALNAYLDTQA